MKLEGKTIIYGYDFDYFFDDKLNIYSTDRLIKNSIGEGYRTIKGKKLNKTLGNHGYYTVNLKVNGKYKNHLLHRVIAKCFLDNKNKYPCVNHKNGIKTDNSVENLEWCTYQHNVRHAFRNGLMNPAPMSEENKEKARQRLLGNTPPNKGNYSGKVKKCLRCSKEFKTRKDSNFCSGKCRSSGKFSHQSRKIKRIDEYGNTIKVYDTITESAKDLNCCNSTITNWLTGFTKPNNKNKGIKLEYYE